MSSNSLFSIIMPAYNRSTLIVEALNSVKAQSYRPIEIIVVDDGSVDDTADVVNRWAEHNKEKNTLSLRYFYQDNAGAGAARNRGIQETQGEYIQFLDSDDIIHPDRLQRLVDVFEKEKCDFIQTGFDGFDAETEATIEVHYGRLKDDLVSQALMGVLWPNTLRSAFRHSLVDRIGPWSIEMTCFEDYEYVVRALICSKKSFAIRDILASARRGGSVRISDRLLTYEGRGYRIHCEELVVALAQKHAKTLSHSVKCKFVARIYHLGVRSYASGWKDLAARCGDVANQVGLVRMNYRCLKWYCLWRLGAQGGRLYNYWLFVRKAMK